MTKRRRESDSDDAAPETAELSAVFVDTSLDTHLAMLLCTSDTVLDFKKKVASEHMRCFPEMGEIEVHSVKVKRRSTFYHLPDIMLVWSAFQGVKKNWFLSVDASSILTCQSTRSSSELGNRNGVRIGLTNVDDDCRGFTCDANRNDIIPVALADAAAEKTAVLEMIARPKVDTPVEKLSNSERSSYSEENFIRAESHAKKRRKVSHTTKAFHDSSLGGNGAVFPSNGNNGKPTMSDSIIKATGVENDQYDGECRLVAEGTSLPSVAEKSNLGSHTEDQNRSDRWKDKDNGFKNMVDYEMVQVVPTQQSGVDSVVLPDSSAVLIDANCGDGVNTAGRKTKKKKVHKTTKKFQDATDTEQIKKGERVENSSDTHKCDKLEEGKGFMLETDGKVIIPSNSQAPGQGDPALALKEESVLQDVEKINFSSLNSQKILDSNGSKDDNMLVSKLDYELDRDAPTVQSGGACTKKSNLSDRLADAAGGIGDVNTDGKKRKKKKVKTTVEKVQDARDVELIGDSEVKEPHAGTINSEEKEEEKGFPSEHDNEVILPSYSKAPDHVDPDSAQKETILLRDAEPEVSTGIKKKKKKKREKKPVGTSIEHSGITEIHNGVKSVALPSQSSDQIPQETGKEENIMLNEGKDAQMKLLDGSNHDAQEKVSDLNGRETDLVIKITEQSVVDVSVVHKKMVENAKSSAGDCNFDLSTAATEITLIDSNQVDKDEGNTENRDRKAKKKRKKKTHSATDIRGNSPVKDQQVGIEPSAIKETSIGFVNSEQEVKHVDSSRILSLKSEEKVDGVHEFVNTDNLAENYVNGSQEINFKQYFVPDQLPTKVDSVVKVRTGTKSQRSSKKAKDNDLPSVNTSTELQNSIKVIENKEREDSSYRKDSGRNKCDSAVNSDRDEICHHSLKRSSEAIEQEVKKNPSPDKSSPEKKILLAKSGAIFEDNSGESSADENGITHLSDSSLSLTDCSSMSDDSAGESELSKNSTSKGSNDAKEKSKSKLDKSASKDMTIEMIMRSSKRYKKAKEVASQMESQSIDFVPESQPS